MALKEKFELVANPHDAKAAAAELCTAYRAGRLGWVFDQLSYLTPFQAAIVSCQMVRQFQEENGEPGGFLTLLQTRAKHEPIPKSERIAVLNG